MTVTAELQEPRSPQRTASAAAVPQLWHLIPLSDPWLTAWNRYVKEHPDGTIFHTTAWRNAVRGSFAHRDHYTLAVRGGRPCGVFPLFQVNSAIAGRMLVSVPYGVAGGILADDPNIAQSLFTHAVKVARENGCRSIDLRGERAVLPNLPVTDRYVSFRRALPARRDEVPAWLPRKARAAARNARDKFGLTVSWGDEQLPEVWRLYSINMRRLASIAYPFHFFRSIAAHTPGGHWTSVIHRQGRPVAGLFTLIFRGRVLPYFFGCSPDARRCSAANFTYFTLMERAVDEGFRIFDFGRTRRDNRGSIDFKRFHGFEPQPLEYQEYTMPGFSAPDLTPSNPRFRWARRIWPHLPLALTRFAGARLSPHVPG